MEILITIKADKDDLTALSTEKESANATPSISERVGEIALSYLERCLRTTPTVSPNSPQKPV